MADGRIEILPGKGLSHENLKEFLKGMNVDQVHGTRLFK